MYFSTLQSRGRRCVCSLVSVCHVLRRALCVMCLAHSCSALTGLHSMSGERSEHDSFSSWEQCEYGSRGMQLRLIISTARAVRTLRSPDSLFRLLCTSMSLDVSDKLAGSSPLSPWSAIESHGAYSHLGNTTCPDTGRFSGTAESGVWPITCHENVFLPSYFVRDVMLSCTTVSRQRTKKMCLFCVCLSVRFV